MGKRLGIPRVDDGGERGLVLRVDAVGVGDEGPFVRADGKEWLLPLELEKWATVAGALGRQGLVELGWRPGLEGTREGGYFAEFLPDDAADDMADARAPEGVTSR